MDRSRYPVTLCVHLCNINFRIGLLAYSRLVLKRRKKLYKNTYSQGLEHLWQYVCTEIQRAREHFYRQTARRRADEVVARWRMNDVTRCCVEFSGAISILCGFHGRYLLSTKRKKCQQHGNVAPAGIPIHNYLVTRITTGERVITNGCTKRELKF